MTENVINIAKPYNTRCTGLAFDYIYKKIIVTTEVQAGYDEGVALQMASAFQSPFSTTVNWNVVVASYSLDRNFIFKNQ